MHCLSKQEGEKLSPHPVLFKHVSQCLDEQDIFYFTPTRRKALADACAMLPAIFQRGLTVSIISGAFARVRVCPFSYAGQLQLTRNYDKIPEEVREHIESQDVFNELVDEALEFHEIRNQTFERLGFPPGETVEEGKLEDHVRPINQRRSLIIGNKDKLAKMNQNAKEAAARSKKAKADAKKAEEMQAAAQARVLVLAEEHRKLQKFHVEKLKTEEEKTKAEIAKRIRAEAEKKKLEAEIQALTRRLALAESNQQGQANTSGCLILSTTSSCMQSVIAC